MWQQCRSFFLSAKRPATNEHHLYLLISNIHKTSSRTRLIHHIAQPDHVQIFHHEVTFANSSLHRHRLQPQTSPSPPSSFVTSFPLHSELRASVPLLSPLVSTARGSMAFSKIISLAVLALTSSVMFSNMAGAVRQFYKRSDLEMIPPISGSGYTLPLEGGWTCHDLPNCPRSSILYFAHKANLNQVPTPFLLLPATHLSLCSPSPAAICPTPALLARPILLPPTSLSRRRSTTLHL